MSPEERLPIRRALVSVFDKRGLDRLARTLAAAGVEVVSTGSTATALEAHGLDVTRVEELTGFPECLDGRVKTLHPKVHAGLLADLRLPAHEAQLAALGIEPFDLLVSNLYPFTQTVAGGASVDESVEQIDIGGPAMVRAAAKNHPSVAVVTSVSAYPLIVNALNDGGFTLTQRKLLAARAFRTSQGERVRRLWWLAAFALVACVALVDEYHQSFLPSRTGTIYDSLLDMTGGATALACAALWLARKRRKVKG